LSSEIVEHSILKSGLKPGRKPKAQPLSEEEITKLLEGLSEGMEIMKNAMSNGCKGYITVKEVDLQQKTSKKKKQTKEQKQNEEEANILKQVESFQKGNPKQKEENNPTGKKNFNIWKSFLFSFSQSKKEHPI
jgi:hypothetical protein